ncbi:hypothetical protein AVHM3334_13735 [Acidovorax sp. SUPP3334]|nr:hypothetical protein AVHM3334_13735 [Acidovorax sp. SUPP3334]
MGCLLLAAGWLAWVVPQLLHGRFRIAYVWVVLGAGGLPWTCLRALWVRITAAHAPGLFEALERIRAKVKGPTELSRCWIVCKALREFPQRRACLVFVELPGLDDDDDGRASLCRWLERHLSLPGPGPLGRGVARPAGDRTLGLRAGAVAVAADGLGQGSAGPGGASGTIGRCIPKPFWTPALNSSG